MFTIRTIDMALSETIIESLAEAEGHIRNALAFASRSERATTVKQLSNIQLIKQLQQVKYQAR